MAQPPRRINPPPRTPVPAAPPDADSPPPPANGDNGNGHHNNTINAEDIYTDGLNAAEALTAVLGPDNLTGHNQADANAAIKQINYWRKHMKTWESLILHLKFNDYAHRGDRRAPHERDNWGWVSKDLKMSRSTVAARAHAVACYDSIPSGDDQR